jgi:hypothetical protein
MLPVWRLRESESGRVGARHVPGRIDCRAKRRFLLARVLLRRWRSFPQSSVAFVLSWALGSLPLPPSPSRSLSTIEDVAHSFATSHHHALLWPVHSLFNDVSRFQDTHCLRLLFKNPDSRPPPTHQPRPVQKFITTIMRLSAALAIAALCAHSSASVIRRSPYDPPPRPLSTRLTLPAIPTKPSPASTSSPLPPLVPSPAKPPPPPPPPPLPPRARP